MVRAGAQQTRRLAAALGVGREGCERLQRFDDSGQETVFVSKSKRVVLQPLGVASTALPVREPSELVVGRSRQPQVVEWRTGKTPRVFERHACPFDVVECHDRGI